MKKSYICKYILPPDPVTMLLAKVTQHIRAPKPVWTTKYFILRISDTRESACIFYFLDEGGMRRKMNGV